MVDDRHVNVARSETGAQIRRAACHKATARSLGSAQPSFERRESSIGFLRDDREQRENRTEPWIPEE